MRGVILWTFLVTSAYSIDSVTAITLDGIREEDIKEKIDNLSVILRKRGYYTYWYGKSHECTTNKSDNISLPAYANFFSGTTSHNVRKNEFKKYINKSTLFDLYGGQLFTSWEPLKRALSASKDVVNKSWFHVKGSDKEVVDLFTTYYVKSKFTFVNFIDADERAHDRNWQLYMKAISEEVEYTLSIIDHVEKHVTEDKMFIIFTDHGRGDGEWWHSHGPWLPESRHIWAFMASTVQLPFNVVICDPIAFHGFVKAALVY